MAQRTATATTRVGFALPYPLCPLCPLWFVSAVLPFCGLTLRGLFSVVCFLKFKRARSNSVVQADELEPQGPRMMTRCSPPPPPIIIPDMNTPPPVLPAVPLRMPARYRVSRWLATSSARVPSVESISAAFAAMRLATSSPRLLMV